MASATIPDNEQERLRALRSYDLLDRDVDDVFEAIIRTAADVCDVDICVIALIDRDRQYFLARKGMEPKETPRAIAFCAHAILDPEKTFEIPDATKDPRFADNPLVTGEIGVRFYAARPLTTPEGYAIGGLCLIGRKPKILDDVQRQTLKDLGDVIMAFFESRKAALATTKSLEEAKEKADLANGAIKAQNERFSVALANMTQGLAKFDSEQRLVFCNERYATIYGFPHELMKPGTTLLQILEHRVKAGLYTCANPEEYIEERLAWVRGGIKRSAINPLSDGRWIAYEFQPLPDGGWVSTHEDVTERKRAEDALKERETQFRNLVEGSIQGLFVVRDWVLLFSNQALADIFGYESPQEILALGQVGPLIAPDERERIWRYKTAREAGTYAPEIFESRGLKKDGSKIDIEFRVRQVDWNGSPAMQCVVVDITEQRRAEARLQAQNWRFNTALDNMSQGLCMFDAEQRITVCNEGYLSLYGLTREQVKPGTTLRQVLEHRIRNGFFAGRTPDEYIAERLSWVKSGVRESKVQELSDGRAIAITHQPMSGGGWVTTHEDVTERKRSTDLLRATVDSFPGGITIFGGDLKLLLANDMFYRLLDLPAETFPVGSLYEDIVRFNVERGDYGAGSPEEMVRERLELVRKFEEHAFERRRPDGTVLEIRGFPLPQGGFVTAYVDITERKKAEHLNLRLARIVEDAINEVFVFDAETLKFLQANASACRNLGYTVEELANMTPLDIKPEFTLEQFEDKIAPLRRGEKDHIGLQTSHRRKDGSLYDTDIVLQQIQSGERPVFAAIVEDVTERKKAERELIDHRDHLQEMVDLATQRLKTKAEELAEALKKEQEMNELQRQFISMASHEFRTPLAVIDGSVQRLLRRKDSLTVADLEDRATKIRAAVKTMTSLMESTLSSARMNAGKMEINVAECDLSGVVLGVCVRQLELNEEHRIVCDLKELPYNIAGDSAALEQVFTNLLTNAVKYSPDGPDITVRGWREGDEAVVSMQDYGLGIDEDDLSHIGERFFRARTSTGIAGTGIGLNLTKILIEEHGGSLKVESIKGEGSTFTVRLPIAGPVRPKQVEAAVA